MFRNVLKPYKAIASRPGKTVRTAGCMTPPPQEAPRFGVHPAKAENAAPLPLDGRQFQDEKEGRRDARLTSEDSVPITPAQSRASMDSHPYSQYTPGSGKSQGGGRQPSRKTAQRGNNPHGVLYGLSLDAARPIEGRREPKPATSRRMTAETNRAFAKIRDNARSVGLDKESVAAVRQFSGTNIHPVPGKVKPAIFTEKAAGVA